MPVADESYDASRGRAENVDTMQSTSPIRPSTRQAAKLSSCHQIQTAAEETYKENLQQTELSQAPSDRIVSHKLTSIQSLAESQTDAAISSVIRETELSTQNSVIASTLSEFCSVPKALAYGIDSEVCGSHLSSQYSPLANSLSPKASKFSSSLRDTDEYTSVIEDNKLRKLERTAECQSPDCSRHTDSLQKKLRSDTVKNENSPSSSISKLQMQQKRQYMKCKCPNCSVEGGNNVRGSNGRILHACHHPNCSRVFDNTGHLRVHIRRHSGEKPYVCTWDACEKKFACMTDLTDHIRRHKKPSEFLHVNSSVGRRNKTRDSYTRRQRVSHMPEPVVSHNSKKDFVCPHCSKEFARKSTLKMHLRTHENATQMVPKNDGAQVSQSLSINAVKKSQKRKRIRCKCPYCIVEGGNQNRHSTGRLLHKCHIPECGRVFTTNTHLKLHLKSCEGEKPVVRFLPLTLLGLRVAKPL